jgi:mono/diheme cytochrome c family protein
MTTRWPAVRGVPGLAVVITIALSACAALATSGCNRNWPGRPRPESRELRPDEVRDFAELYGHNCSGCHGPDGTGGAALALANPVYLAITDEETLRRVTSTGVPGTSMPAFAREAGGRLTGDQIDVIVREIRGRWSRPDALGGATPPAYRADAAGESVRGAETIRTFCGSCHGPEGKGGTKGSSIVDGSYLGLVSDQSLRTTVIAGRPDLGQPDWRHAVAGRSLSGQDVSDIVAWLASQRPRYPGQPYPAARSMELKTQKAGG